MQKFKLICSKFHKDGWQMENHLVWAMISFTFSSVIWSFPNSCDAHNAATALQSLPQTLTAVENIRHSRSDNPLSGTYPWGGARVSTTFPSVPSEIFGGPDGSSMSGWNVNGAGRGPGWGCHVPCAEQSYLEWGAVLDLSFGFSKQKSLRVFPSPC